MLSTPVKFVLSEEILNLCLNCKSSDKEKRRFVKGEVVEIIHEAYDVPTNVEGIEKAFICNKCFNIVRKFTSAKKKGKTCAAAFRDRGNGPIKNLL